MSKLTYDDVIILNKMGDEKAKDTLTFTTLGLLLGWSLFQVSRKLQAKGTSEAAPAAAPVTTKAEVASDKLSDSAVADSDEKNRETETVKVRGVLEAMETRWYKENQELDAEIVKSTAAELKKRADEAGAAASAYDVLEHATVRVAEVQHLKDFFPDLKPIVSPL